MPGRPRGAVLRVQPEPGARAGSDRDRRARRTGRVHAQRHDRPRGRVRRCGAAHRHGSTLGRPRRHQALPAGGLGSHPDIEGIGPAYELPNRHGYAETCAAIGLVQWAQRLGNLTTDGQYVDTLERALYNAVLSGASADGTRYFYDNPLASGGDVHRQEWFDVSCCPANIARLVSELGHYLYAQGDDEAVVNLYATSTARFELAGQTVTVAQRTTYPQTGTITLEVEPERANATFTLAVRIPWWARRVATLNGEPVPDPPVGGCLRIERSWTRGDTVTLELDLSPRRTGVNPAVAAAAGCVALERGPIVYGFKRVDHPIGVGFLTLPRRSTLTEHLDGETGYVYLHAVALAEDAEAAPLYRVTPPRVTPVELTAVPYFSWGNRGLADMSVWIREATTLGHR